MKIHAVSVRLKNPYAINAASAAHRKAGATSEVESPAIRQYWFVPLQCDRYPRRLPRLKIPINLHE